MNKRQAKIEALTIIERTLQRLLDEGGAYSDSSTEEAAKIEHEIDAVLRGVQRRLNKLCENEAKLEHLPF